MNERGSLNMQRFLKQLILLGGLWCCMSTVFGALSVEAKPDKISQGETFNLIITSDQRQASLPNLKPLQKDFKIMGTERTMSYTVINGQAESIQNFIVQLMPNKTGVLTIPALQVGQNKTTPIKIEVQDAINASQNTNQQIPASQAAAEQKLVMLKTEVNQSSPYVGEEVVYTVKLYNSSRLMDADYQPPQVENGLIISLGNADRYQTNENGRNYVVEEQRYAIFPQKSGKTTIIGPSFHALLYDVYTKQVNLPSKKTQLDVKPVPPPFTPQDWLPAKQINLSEDYSAPNNPLEQGETITRTLTFEAIGLPAELLPVLTFEDQKAFNVYPEKPMLKNLVKNNELVGTSTLKVTYLMNEPGKVTLPELVLTWFNTTTGKKAQTKLPPKTFQVKPAVTQGALPKASNSQPSMPTESVKAEKNAPSLPPTSPSSNSSPNPLPWFLAIIFGVAWLLTIIVWWFRPLFIHSNQRRKALKDIHAACIQNNPSKAREALLAWAAIHWPEQAFIDLNDLGKQIADAEFKKQLNLLSKAIYSPTEKRKWEGTQLWLVIAAYRTKQRSRRKQKGDLPPINP